MDSDFIPFDSDEDLPTKRHHQSKEDQIYGIFYNKSPHHEERPSKNPKKSNLNESELTQTYGKGLSLLQKHGYKVGDGLGKNSQGTTEIIDVKIRKKNEGLSYSKPESNPDLQPEKNPLKPKRPKKSDPSIAKDFSFQSQTISKAAFYEDTLISLDYEEKQIERTLLELNLKSQEIHEFLEIIEKSNENLEELVKVFKEVKKFSVFHDFFIYEGFLVPMFRDFFFEKWKDWDFGRNQLLGFDLFQSWITIGSAVDVADIWEKAVNTFFTINWQAKLELGENIDGLEKWKQFIPSENFEVVCKTIVGKLGREIENWNLFVENVAIHTWVLPWICLLDLGSIYPRIISKFELALDKWQAKDRSAKLLLKPWKVVLSQFWDDFVVLHVLPKLLLFLQEFEIPQDFSKTKSIKCVVEWVGLIPIEHIRDGFRNIFYPKWRKVLNGLLESSLDMEKVFEWVKYWQKKVPEQILKIEI